MPLSTRAISAAFLSSTSRSSPNTLTTTCAVLPAMISSMRSVRKGLIETEGPGTRATICAQFVFRLLRIFDDARLQVDMNFARMNAFGIVAQFGAADLLRDQAHAGILQQFAGDDLADAHGLLERSAGQQIHVHDEMAFAHFRQELAAHEGHQRAGRDASRQTWRR